MMAESRSKNILHLFVGSFVFLISLAFFVIGAVSSGLYYSVVLWAWSACIFLLLIALLLPFDVFNGVWAAFVRAMYFLCILFYAKAMVDIFYVYGYFYPLMIILMVFFLSVFSFWIGSKRRWFVYRHRNFIIYPSVVAIFVFPLGIGFIFFVGSVFSILMILVAALMSFSYSRDES